MNPRSTGRALLATLLALTGGCGESTPSPAIAPGTPVHAPAGSDAPSTVTPFQRSALRRGAEARGLFRDLPTPNAASLESLLQTFQALERRVRDRAGRGEAPDGASSSPTDDDLLLAEVGSRLEAALAEATARPDQVPVPPEKQRSLTYATFDETGTATGTPRWAAVTRTIRVTSVPRTLADSARSRAAALAKRIQSRDNLRTLALMLLARSLSEGFAPLNGKAFVLSAVMEQGASAAGRRDLKILFSPADAERSLDRIDPARYAALTVAALKDGRDLSALTSYCGRRNADPDCALTPRSAAEEAPVLADLSFPDVALVAYASGKVVELDRGALGLEPGDPIVVGPASKSAILRCLSAE